MRSVRGMKSLAGYLPAAENTGKKCVDGLFFPLYQIVFLEEKGAER